MRILGIDPGYGRLGYACIQCVNDCLTVVDVGCFETAKEDEHRDRLLQVAGMVQKLMMTHQPDVIGIEKLFFQKNVSTAMKVSEARGVVLAECAQSRARVVECSPQEVKIAVTGYGNADKRQVQEMVRILLKLKEIPKPDDAADALAVAIAASRSFVYR